MKKRNLMPAVKKTAKSAFALSLAATMVVPTGVSVAAAEGEATGETVTVPEPIKVIDFNEGLQELMNEDDNFSITQSEEVYFQKDPSEVGSTERVDDNGLVYTGEGSQARYHKGRISNQPTTAWDEEKGTVLKIGKSQTIPAVYKSKPAGIADTAGSAALDAALPYESTQAAVSGEGVLVQEAYTSNSEIVISNPFGSEELAASLVEYSEFDIPDNDDDNIPEEEKRWKKFRSNRYQPIWEKGLTLSYWIKVPTDEQGNYKPSSVLRWELLNQEYYQADDYAKHLACKYLDEEKKKWTDEDYTLAKAEESKVNYGSMYYFKYLETEGVDAEGAPVAKEYRGAAGFSGPVYDSRFIQGTNGCIKSQYYQFNPVFKRGYTQQADGTYEAQLAELVGSTENYYSLYASLEIEEGSYVRRADVDGELQIDVDNSIFWVPDNNQGINKNPNVTASFGSKAGMQNGDVFFMNSWQEGKEKDAAGNGTYQSAKTVALSPVTSAENYNIKDGVINYKGVKNGNCNEWHQVTVTLQNDWVEFYVDGQKTDVDTRYSSRGLVSIDKTESFKRLNKGTGLRYGWGAEKGAINFSFGNYVCRLLMDWITDEEATLHIGGAGQYAKQYAQATISDEFSLDDLKFYGELLTEEQIVAAYDAEVAAMNETPNVTGAAVVDLSVVSDVSLNVTDAVKNVKETIEGKEMDGVKVAGNASLATSTGAMLSNPFAGKELEGATIAYWVKQDDNERSSVVSFYDTEKFVYHPKEDGAEASSILYIANDGTAQYYEGYSNKAVGESLKNTYSTSNVTEAAVLLEKSSEWNYVTVTMTNAGIKYYMNGELVENKNTYATGVRFLDGYYQRLADEADVITRKGAFGSTNNQCATTLMSFITNEDTDLYLGYYPDKGGMGYIKTSGATFAGIKTVDAALTDEEVKALYANRLNVGGSVEPAPVVESDGDINGDGTVDLKDAQAALKMALKITTDATDDQKKIADVTADGIVDLKDAQKILKIALKIKV